MTTTPQAEPKPSSAAYLYAVCRADAAPPPSVRGLDDQPIELVTFDDLAAVISSPPAGKLRPERRHMTAHQRVLAALSHAITALPVSFGVQFKSRTELLSVLTPSAQSLREQLDHVDGKVEMSLRVSWDVPNIFQHFVERSPDLRAFRDALIAEGGGGSHTTKMAAGRLFERLLEEDRERHTRTILSALDPVCDQVHTDPPRSESQIMRSALLVRRDRLEELDAAVSAAAVGFDASYRFDLSGPWAPHSFVSLTLGEPAEAA